MTGSYAVIDIGSNSVRMVIFDTSQSPPLQLFNEKVFCGLGRDLDVARKLNTEGVKTALKTIQAFVLLAEAMKISKLSAVATAAVREAKDGTKFIKKIYDITNVRVRILSGDEEARYAALGVLSLDQKAKGIVGDFGGGSLELATLSPKGVDETLSYPLGAFRLIHARTAAHKLLKTELEAAPRPFRNQEALYVIGGSWRALAQLYLGEHAKAPPRLQGQVIQPIKLIPFCEGLIRLTPANLRKKYHIEKHRAELIPVAALALKEVIHELRPRKIIISTAGLRDGVIAEYLTA
jgi:exopolyphosphatase / guanosine-5'-triphosphate,3'-diphosphate pyrophosphatase